MNRRFAIGAVLTALCCTLAACNGGTVAPVTTSSTPSTTASVAVTTTIPQLLNDRVFGYSIQGRALRAFERGDASGIRVVVIGSIHGNENAGHKIIDVLKEMNVPSGIDLWLVPSINPDGVALKQRGNANGVDLNRNFPYKWGPIAKKGDWEWSGPAAESEPETKATVAFLSSIEPDLVLWYHQDLFCISPSDGREGEIRKLYSDLTGIPLKSITGGTYTGVAATWQRNTITNSIGFVVELGPKLSLVDARRYASAVLEVAARM